MSVIVLAIVFTSVFNLLLVYRTQCTLSRVNVDGKDDGDPPHSKGKLTYHLRSARNKKIPCRLTGYELRTTIV